MRMRRFIDYYKWHLFFLLLIIVCLGFIFINMASKTEPDLVVGYLGINYVNVQTFNDNKSEIELLLRDANDDGEKISTIYAYAVDLESDLHDTFADMIDSDDYDIYITTKAALKKVKDKSVFVAADEYVTLTGKEIDTLKDKSGRTYAVSLEDNDYVKKMGILNTTDLYIAVAQSQDEKDGELPGNRKNGRNIAGYIIGEE